MTLILFDHLISELVYVLTQITFTVPQNQIPPASLLQSHSVHLSSLRNTALVSKRPKIMLEKTVLPLIQKMVQGLCLDHFPRHLGLTEPAEQCWLYLQRSDRQAQVKKSPRQKHCFYHLSLSEKSTISSRNSTTNFFNMGWVLMTLVLFYLPNSLMNLLRLSYFKLVQSWQFFR